MRSLLCCLAVAITLMACNNNSNTPAPTTEGTITTPAETNKASEVITLFNQKCAGCHGEDGAAGIGGAANLQLSKLDTTTIENTITNGKGNMPAFKTLATASEIKMLVAYVKALSNKN